MLGWWKKRARFEQIKLVAQNELAVSYLSDFMENSLKSGLGSVSDLIDALENASCEIQMAAVRLLAANLDAEEMKTQLAINRELRQIYDAVLSGRREFAKKFGASSERLDSFEKKFEPNEGWKAYVERFDIAKW